MVLLSFIFHASSARGPYYPLFCPLLRVLPSLLVTAQPSVCEAAGRRAKIFLVD
jgi:hypothetical protein